MKDQDEKCVFAGQEQWLAGVALVYRSWKAVGRNDHDHCDICWAKFAEFEDCLHEGYCTPDSYYWICPECFSEFKERFGWKLQSHDPAE